jgi:hypothetical protein
MQRLAWIVGISLILQYGLAVSNITSENNLIQFPSPFNPYQTSDRDDGRFIIPRYRKVPLLRDNLDWALYLGMGISNTKFEWSVDRLFYHGLHLATLNVFWMPIHPINAALF